MSSARSRTTGDSVSLAKIWNCSSMERWSCSSSAYPSAMSITSRVVSRSESTSQTAYPVVDAAQTAADGYSESGRDPVGGGRVGVGLRVLVGSVVGRRAVRRRRTRRPPHGPL